MGYIYMIRNTVNGKAYIGQTIQKVEKRIDQHFNRTNCSALHNAIEKYGRDAFTIEILHEVLDIFLDELEIEEIKKHNTMSPNGYNLTTGGNSNTFVSDETRRKLSEAQKGKNPTDETRRKMSEAQKGRKRGTPSPETRRKMSEAQKGRKYGPLSLETRRKISEAQKGRNPTDKTRRKISEAKKGKKRGTPSPEHRKKLSEALKGRKFSPEHRKKLSEAQKMRYNRHKSD